MAEQNRGVIWADAALDWIDEHRQPWETKADVEEALEVWLDTEADRLGEPPLTEAEEQAFWEVLQPL